MKIPVNIAKIQIINVHLMDGPIWDILKSSKADLSPFKKFKALFETKIKSKDLSGPDKIV